MWKVGDILRLKSEPKETTIQITGINRGTDRYDCKSVLGYGAVPLEWTNQKLSPDYWCLVKQAKKRVFK